MAISTKPFASANILVQSNYFVLVTNSNKYNASKPNQTFGMNLNFGTIQLFYVGDQPLKRLKDVT